MAPVGSAKDSSGVSLNVLEASNYKHKTVTKRGLSSARPTGVGCLGHISDEQMIYPKRLPVSWRIN